MNPDCPNPMEDPVGYHLWCEMMACEYCHGTGQVDDDRYDDREMDCPACNGSGISEDSIAPMEDDR